MSIFSKRYRCPSCGFTSNYTTHDILYSNEHIEMHVAKKGGMIVPFVENQIDLDSYLKFTDMPITNFNDYTWDISNYTWTTNWNNDES